MITSQISSQPSSELQGLVDVLTWRQASTAPAHWRTSYEEMLEQRLLSIADENEEALSIVEALAFLPRPHQLAFLRAPLVASRLLGYRDGAPLDAGPIVKSLMAELVAAAIDCDLIEPAWTVLGDRCVDPSQGGDPVATQTRIPGTTIAIDKAGPIDFSVGSLRPLEHPTEPQWVAIEPKLTDAARELAAASRPAFDFWQDCIDVIALRTFAQPGVSITSVALRYNARVTLLVNAYAADVDSTKLADLLLHEAIHSLLFMWEETSGHFVPNKAAREEVKIISPWSGHSLKLSAFVHGCLVWYGIYWFWKIASERKSSPVQKSRELMQAARMGFDKKPVSTLLSDHARHLSDEIAALLAAIEARIREE